jgi:release factor glutamine methyltransferase
VLDKKLLRVCDVIALFRKELEGLYPAREVDCFLSLAFEEVMNMSKIDVLIQTNAPIGSAQRDQFEAILQGLKRQEPIQYLMGKTLFYGIPIEVNSDVLIPRPETEELVHWVLHDHLPESPRIIDLGTGSGCIAIALKSHFPTAQVFGVDNNVGALNVANRNASQNGLQIEFFHFDILMQESFGFMDFDVIVSNPPYVTPDEKKAMDNNVLLHEPHHALFVPEDDPLVYYRRIVDLADGHLNRGGKLYFEINQSYGSEVLQLLRDRNYREAELRKDLNGRDRMIRAIKS